MSEPPIGTRVHQTFDVHRHLTAQTPLHLIFPLYRRTQFRDLLLRELADAGIWRNLRLLRNLSRRGSADAVNIRQSDLYTLFPWQIYSGYPGQTSTLLLQKDEDRTPSLSLDVVYVWECDRSLEPHPSCERSCNLRNASLPRSVLSSTPPYVHWEPMTGDPITNHQSPITNH